MGDYNELVVVGLVLVDIVIVQKIREQVAEMGVRNGTLESINHQIQNLDFHIGPTNCF